MNSGCLSFIHFKTILLHQVGWKRTHGRWMPSHCEEERRGERPDHSSQPQNGGQDEQREQEVARSSPRLHQVCIWCRRLAYVFLIICCCFLKQCFRRFACPKKLDTGLRLHRGTKKCRDNNHCAHWLLSPTQIVHWPFRWFRIFIFHIDTNNKWVVQRHQISRQI